MQEWMPVWVIYLNMPPGQEQLPHLWYKWRIITQSLIFQCWNLRKSKQSPGYHGPNGCTSRFMCRWLWSWTNASIWGLKASKLHGENPIAVISQIHMKISKEKTSKAEAEWVCQSCRYLGKIKWLSSSSKACSCSFVFQGTPFEGHAEVPEAWKIVKLLNRYQ